MRTADMIESQASGEPVEKLMTYREAARVLNVTHRTLWSLVDRGELPAVRFGRSVRIDPADLRAFIDAAKTTPASRSWLVCNN